MSLIFFSLLMIWSEPALNNAFDYMDMRILLNCPRTIASSSFGLFLYLDRSSSIMKLSPLNMVSQSPSIRFIPYNNYF